jgi:hypothetical protein
VISGVMSVVHVLLGDVVQFVEFVIAFIRQNVILRIKCIILQLPDVSEHLLVSHLRLVATIGLLRTGNQVNVSRVYLSQKHRAGLVHRGD